MTEIAHALTVASLLIGCIAPVGFGFLCVIHLLDRWTLSPMAMLAILLVFGWASAWWLLFAWGAFR